MTNKQKTLQSVEKNLLSIIKKYKLAPKVSIDRVKEWVLNEAGETNPAKGFEKYTGTWTKFIPKIESLEEMDTVFSAFVDAWNYFPHKKLGNKSPVEAKQKTISAHVLPKESMEGLNIQSINNDNESLAREMFNEIFRKQDPFVDWLYEDVLPEYEKHLESKIQTARIRKQRMAIAEIFFDRVLRAGIVDYEDIPEKFINHVFPKFWEQKVYPEPLSAQRVQGVLGDMVDFIYHKFHRFPGGVGDIFNRKCLLNSLDIVLPGIAEQERQVVELLGKKYSLAEQYCIDTFCDCRKVILSLLNQEEKKVDATIGTAWGDPTLPQEIEPQLSVFLDLTGEQGSNAEELLKAFTEQIKRNEKMLQTFKNHYLMFKRSV